jgi:hypothetical protein
LRPFIIDTAILLSGIQRQKHLCFLQVFSNRYIHAHLLSLSNPFFPRPSAGGPGALRPISRL